MVVLARRDDADHLPLYRMGRYASGLELRSPGSCTVHYRVCRIVRLRSAHAGRPAAEQRDLSRGRACDEVHADRPRGFLQDATKFARIDAGFLQEIRRAAQLNQWLKL